MVQTKQMCEQNKIIPNKSYGQNFLIDKNVLRKIIEAAELNQNDTVIEIGAGTGTLTEELARRAGRVIAFEIDKKLVAILKENLKEFSNVDIHSENVLDTKYQIPDTGFKLVANIPYNITSSILEKFLSARPQRCACASGQAARKPSLMVLLVQKEVAERVCALPRPLGRGRPGEMSFLSVMVQYYGRPSIVATVPAGAFWPKPKVESAVLKISDISARGESALGGENKFFRLVKVGFSNRRKMLKGNLKPIFGAQAGDILALSGVSPTARAQELSVEDWKKLFRVLK